MKKLNLNRETLLALSTQQTAEIDGAGATRGATCPCSLIPGCFSINVGQCTLF